MIALPRAASSTRNLTSNMLPDFAAPEPSGLQRIETEQVLTREIWLVVHSDIKDVPSVRVVVDALKSALGK